MEQEKVNSLDNIIDFREFLFKIINNWYYFLLSILFMVFNLISLGKTRHRCFDDILSKDWLIFVHISKISR